jgi:hypothetical protein
MDRETAPADTCCGCIAMAHEEARAQRRIAATRWLVVVPVLLSLAGGACSSIIQPVTPVEKAAKARVANALNPANRPGIGLEDLRSKPNPNGHGVFVFVEKPYRVRGVNQRFIWVVLKGKAYALNAPSKELTPPLPWSREAPQTEWLATNLNPYSAIDAMKIVFGK